MYFRNWLHVFILISLTLAGSVQAQQLDGEIDQAPTGQQSAIDQLPFAVPVIITESDEDAETRRSEGRERTQRDKDNLAVQQAMNEATQSMKRASWWSAGLVAIGTILLIWTLMLTRSANLAAQDAVSVTREIGEAQVRGYVVATKLDLKFGQDAFEFTLQFGLAGLSPIRQLQADYMVRIGFPDGEIFQSHFGSKGRTVTVQPSNVMKPDEIVTLRTSIKFSEFSGEIPSDGVGAIQPKVFISYTDVFNRNIIQCLSWYSPWREGEMSLSAIGPIHIDEWPDRKWEGV